MGTPEEISLMAQLLLIGLADPLQNLADAIQIRDLPAHLGNLSGVKGDLAGFSAGVVHIQDPLVMALAAGTGGAGDTRGMKGVALEQGAAQQIVKRRELGEQLGGGIGLLRGSLLSHLHG
jgi:hypothetical protein